MRRHRVARAWLLTLGIGVALAHPAALRAQVRDGATLSSQVGTARLTGMVVAADNPERSLRRTLLTLSGGELRTSLLMLSDDEGRFEFRGLPPGRFTLTAQKSGYVRDVYGARPVGSGTGVPIAIRDAGEASVTVRLVRSAALSGRIIMPPGAPVASVRLQLLKWSTLQGRRELVSARGGAYGVGGNGEYRIGGLPPGEYVLAAYLFGRNERRLQGTEGPGAIVDLAPVFSPGTTDQSRAQAVRLAAGDDRAGFDLILDFVPMGRVSGRVIGPNGEPLPTMQVSLVESSPINRLPAPMRTLRDGTFVLPPTAPGQYTLVARGALPGAVEAAKPGAFNQSPPLPLWASETIVITPGGRVDGLELRLRPGRTIRGRLVFEERAGATPNPSGVFLGMLADGPDTVAAGLPVTQPAADGTFEIQGVAPGRYRLQMNLPAPLRSTWMINAMELDGKDVLDAPIVVGPDADVALRVSLSDQLSVVTGTVTGAEGRPLPERSVIAFSTARAHWTQPSRRVAHVRSGVDGTYEARGLPDGEYLIAAIEAIASDDVMTAEFLEALVSTARTVKVRHRERTVQDLSIARVP